MSNPINNRSEQLASDQNLINGLTKNQATLPPLLIGGTSYKATDAIAVLQKRIDTAKAVAPAKAAWQAAVSAEDAEISSTKSFVSGLKAALLVAFASSPSTLADFGLNPRKPNTPLTVQQKAAAKAKAAATRAARHTMSKKQKQAIKGTVTPPPPVTATATVTATAAPPATSAASAPVTAMVATPHA